MNVHLENLELIPTILEKLEIIEAELKNGNTKRWLNTIELSEYLGYSKNRLYKLKDEFFVEGIHYHKKGKILFDRLEIDKWVTSNNKIKNKNDEIVKKLLSSVINK